MCDNEIHETWAGPTKGKGEGRAHVVSMGRAWQVRSVSLLATGTKCQPAGDRHIMSACQPQALSANLLATGTNVNLLAAGT